MLKYLKTVIFPKQILAGYVMVNRNLYPGLENGLDFKLQNKEIFEKSLDRFSTELCLQRDCVVIANQMHQDNILLINDKVEDFTSLEADAIITENPKIIPAIRTADCGNILLYDPVTKVRAAIHSGYRGTSLNIVCKTINYMSSLMVKPENILAFIGPSISQNALWVWRSSAKLCPLEYKVKVDNENFLNKEKQENSNIFRYIDLAQMEIDSYPDDQKPGYLIDLNGWIKYQLLQSGVEPRNIETCNINTFEDRNFHSQRRSRLIDGNAGYGLGLAFIAFR